MRRIIKGLIIGGLLFSGQVLAAPADDMRGFLERREFDEAYRVGSAHPEELGNPLFDLYFGIAAIETGRGGEGVLALERYRMAEPQDAQGVLHLARGYLILGEAARARVELDALLADSPSPEATEAAGKLLETARAQESAAAGGARFYLEAGLGYDDNVNGGVGSSVVTLPVFGQVVLPDRVTKTGDMFTHLAAGGRLSHNLEPGLSVFGAVDAGTRLHSNDTDYDQNTLGGHVGVALNRGGTLWRATASHQTLWLENDRYRSVTGLAGEWATGLNPGGMVNAFAQYARFDYGKLGAGVRDADFYGLGAGYRQIFSGAWRPVVSLALTLGDERNDRDRHDFSRHLWGVSGTVSITPLPRVGLTATLMHQESRYRDDDPLLRVTRRDRFDSLVLGVNYLIDRQFSVRGEVSYFDNRSNIPLYAYDRLQGMVKLRYEF